MAMPTMMTGDIGMRCAPLSQIDPARWSMLWIMSYYNGFLPEGQPLFHSSPMASISPSNHWLLQQRRPRRIRVKKSSRPAYFSHPPKTVQRLPVIPVRFRNHCAERRTCAPSPEKSQREKPRGDERRQEEQQGEEGKETSAPFLDSDEPDER